MTGRSATTRHREVDVPGRPAQANLDAATSRPRAFTPGQDAAPDRAGPTDGGRDLTGRGDVWAEDLPVVRRRLPARCRDEKANGDAARRGRPGLSERRDLRRVGERKRDDRPRRRDEPERATESLPRRGLGEADQAQNNDERTDAGGRP